MTMLITVLGYTKLLRVGNITCTLPNNSIGRIVSKLSNTSSTLF